MNKHINFITITFAKILVLTLFFLMAGSSNVSAQDDISLSITPPLLEVKIAPGKTYKQTYILTNKGLTAEITPQIVYFDPSDNLGNIKLSQDSSPLWVKYNPDSFVLKSGEEKQFIVEFSPPADALEVDYYLTLIFETGKPTNPEISSSSLYRAKIGTNILITVTINGNPKKSAGISSFEAPRIVDWLTDITYHVEIANTGHSFIKPYGEIIISSPFSKPTVITLAPQNILSGSKRAITCIDGEKAIDCTFSKKPHIGYYKAELSFKIDDQNYLYKQNTDTVALPFSGIAVLAAVILFKKLLKAYKK